MHTVLIVVTALSIAAVIALSVVIARLLREDRQRSDARVAALAMLAADAAPDPIVDSTRSRCGERASKRRRHPGERRCRRSPSHCLISSCVPRTPIRRPELFAARDAESPWGRRFAVIGTLAAVLAAVLLAATFGGRRPAGPPAAGSTTAAATANVAPIELLATRTCAGVAAPDHLRCRAEPGRRSTTVAPGRDRHRLRTGRQLPDERAGAGGRRDPRARAGLTVRRRDTAQRRRVALSYRLPQRRRHRHRSRG